MSLVVTSRVLRSKKWWTMWWSVGVAAFVVVNIIFYPSFRNESEEMNKMFEDLPETIRSLMGMGEGVDPFSPLGYLSSQVYAFALPLLLLIAAISLAGAITGDEEHGLLEITYALPLRRSRIFLERFFALLVLAVVLSAVGFVATAVSCSAVDLEMSIGAMAWASITVTALVLAVSGCSTLIGALTGRRGIAITVGTVVAIAGYVITSLADANIHFFEVLRPLSVFSLYDAIKILQTGGPSWSLLALCGVALVTMVGSLVLLERRDLRNA